MHTEPNTILRLNIKSDLFPLVVAICKYESDYAPSEAMLLDAFLKLQFMNGLLQSCEHPVRINDKVKGGYMFVPCGHCDSCRRKYQLAWRERLEAESRNSEIGRALV